MNDEDGYFGESVPARYDESSTDMFEPSVVDAVVDVLAGPASTTLSWDESGIVTR